MIISGFEKARRCVRWVRSPHSDRNAMEGSICMARRAGTIAATTRMSATAAQVGPSYGETSVALVARMRMSGRLPATPAPRPIATGIIDRRKTAEQIARGSAPIAIRIPSSRLCRATENATTLYSPIAVRISARMENPPRIPAATRCGVRNLATCSLAVWIS